MLMNHSLNQDSYIYGSIFFCCVPSRKKIRNVKSRKKFRPVIFEENIIFYRKRLSKIFSILETSKQKNKYAYKTINVFIITTFLVLFKVISCYALSLYRRMLHRRNRLLHRSLHKSRFQKCFRLPN